MIDTSCAALLQLARRGPRVRAKSRAHRRRRGRMAGRLSVVQGGKAHRVTSISSPALRLSDLARRGFLRLNNVPHYSDRLRGATSRTPSAGRMRGSTPTACSASPSCAFTPSRCATMPRTDQSVERSRTSRSSERRTLASAAIAASGSPARVTLAGHLLQAKGDRVAMHSSVEVRYPFLDEDVFDFIARLASALETARLPRQASPAPAGRTLGAALRLTAGTKSSSAPRWTASTWTRSRRSSTELLSEESLRSTGYFDPVEVKHWRTAFRKMRAGSLPRLSVEMGLTAVVATQLWHHLFMGDSLADLPDWSSIPTPAATEAAVAA